MDQWKWKSFNNCIQSLLLLLQGLLLSYFFCCLESLLHNFFSTFCRDKRASFVSLLACEIVVKNSSEMRFNWPIFHVNSSLEKSLEVKQMQFSHMLIFLMSFMNIFSYINSTNYRMCAYINIILKRTKEILEILVWLNAFLLPICHFKVLHIPSRIAH